jgi:predicted SAM-dependent methyltransferase
MAAEADLAKKRLHLGCGRTIMPGWVNLDMMPGMGVDVAHDLDRCDVTPLPFEADTFDEFLASHLFEHLRNPLPFMQELHRIAKPGAMATFRVPYGSSDDAMEDPTHVRLCFLNTFGFFSQPFYWRADYGYRGDWQ